MKKLKNIEIIFKVLENLKISIWKKKYYSIFLMWFITSIISIAEPFFFINIISKIEEFYKSWIFNLSELSFHIIIWISYILFYLIVTYINRYFFVDKSCLKYYVFTFKKYSEIILQIWYNEFLSRKSWELYSILNKWVRDSFNLLFFIFLDVIRSMSWVILLIFVLFYINPIMTFASVSMLPALIFVWYFFNRKTVKLQKEVNDYDDKNYWILADSISNTQLVKTLTLENEFFKILSKNVNKSFLKQIPISFRWSFSDINTWFLVMIARIITILTWVYLISIWELSLSLLFLYFSFVWWIYFPISFMFSKLRNIQEQLTTVWKFFETFESLETEKDLKIWKKVKNIKWKIEFSKVSFWYVKDKKIFEDLNFTINPWKKVAFVWNTWAGKSTVVSLMFRFWDTNKWEIHSK